MNVIFKSCGFNLKTDKITVAFEDDAQNRDFVFEIDKLTRKVLNAKNGKPYDLPVSLESFNYITEECVHYDMRQMYSCEAKFTFLGKHISFVSQKLIDGIIVAPDKKSGWYMPKLYYDISKYIKCENNMLINSIICSHINRIVFMAGVMYARLCEYTPGGVFLTLNNCINDNKNIAALKKYFALNVSDIKKYKGESGINYLPDINKLKYDNIECGDNVNAVIKEHIRLNGLLVELIIKSKCETLADIAMTVVQSNIFNEEYSIYLSMADYMVKSGLLEKAGDIVYLTGDDVYGVLRNETYKDDVREKIVLNRRAANIIKHNPYPSVFDVYGNIFD